VGPGVGGGGGGGGFGQPVNKTAAASGKKIAARTMPQVCAMNAE
jgi:hypothetical protein